MMIVVGTSAKVYPAAGYIPTAIKQGARIVVVDPNAADVHSASPGDFVFAEDAATALPVLLEPLIGKLQADGSFQKTDA